MLNHEDTNHQTVIAENAIPKNEPISLSWEQFKLTFALVSVDLNTSKI